jgi:hypothetical protein
MAESYKEGYGSKSSVLPMLLLMMMMMIDYSISSLLFASSLYIQWKLN